MSPWPGIIFCIFTRMRQDILPSSNDSLRAPASIGVHIKRREIARVEVCKIIARLDDIGSGVEVNGISVRMTRGKMNAVDFTAVDVQCYLVAKSDTRIGRRWHRWEALAACLHPCPHIILRNNDGRTSKIPVRLRMIDMPVRVQYVFNRFVREGLESSR